MNGDSISDIIGQDNIKEVVDNLYDKVKEGTVLQVLVARVDKDHTINWSSANMSGSELIGMLEIIKINTIKHLPEGR